MIMESEEMKYEEALARLEKLVSEIEDPSRSLETISADVKKAVELIGFCRKKLRENEEMLSKSITFEK